MAAGTTQLRVVVRTSEGTEHEVAVSVPDGRTVGEAAAAIASHLGFGEGAWTLRPVRTARALDPAADVRLADVRTGDLIEITRSAARAPVRQPPPERWLVVAAGPSAGRWIPLATGGEVVVGRSRQADVTLADTEVSRRHLRVVVAADGLTVEDLGSSNGTRVDGVPIAAPTPVRDDSVIEAGRSMLRVSSQAPAVDLPAEGGHVPFNRPPRVTRPAPRRTFAIAAPPDKAEKRRLPMASALAPLLVGVVMAAVMRSPQYLAFALLSPVMAVWSFVEDRRGGHASYADRKAAFEKQVSETMAQAAAAVAAEAQERRAAAPDAAALLRRLAGPAPELWERWPGDDDFLSARAGWGDRPSQVEVLIEPGGDADLRAQAERSFSALGTVPAVPVVVPLHGVVGLCGRSDDVASTARWLLAQAALLHSPRDVVIAAAVPAAAAEEWAWLSWLPHTGGEGSPIRAAQLAYDADSARALIDAVNAVVSARHAEVGARLAGTGSRFEPAILAVLHGELEVPRAAVTTILERGPAVGVHVLWLGSTAATLPGECTTVVTRVADPVTITVTQPATGEQVADVLPDELALDAATAAARALAPVVDVGARHGTSELPTTVGLPEILGLADATPGAVTHRWEQSEPGVDAPLGVTAAGPFVVDLRHDGPHALVGGTTGAGKSELLQTLVASMAATHRPDEVTFLLVDYKGGAAFKDCVRLPHTVGYVTDLDGHLVQRALVSLNAELRRREHLLAEAGAKDLVDMERKAPGDAPPSLVLVVDEFATLAKELPEFVDGVVNVAQRGRSLGIHLVLATQRPAGAINDNIRANTNLRIALRMNDAADSEDVIGAKVAALLPRTTPGRAYARTGASELTELQVAYAGAQSLVAATRDVPDPVEVSDVHLGQVTRLAAAAAPEDDDDDRPTDLQMVVEAIVAASRQAGIEPPVRPWVPPLPELLVLSDMPDGALGLIDEPDLQRQTAWALDLESEGSLLVYGTGGSGKTTFLRTLVASLATHAAPAQLHVFGIDTARGLDVLRALPHVGDIVPADDVDGVRALLRMLRRETDERKATLGDHHAAALSDVPSAHRPPRIVVLIDSFAGFSAAVEDVDHGALLEQLPQLVTEGRAAGIHYVVTADRRASVPMWLSAAFTMSLVLRVADPDDVGMLGLDRRAVGAMDVPPGRGYLPGTREVQIAAVSSDPSGAEQASVLAEMGAHLQAIHGPDRAPRVPVLGATVTRSQIGATPREAAGELLLAVADHDHLPRAVRRASGHVLIAGGAGSGRSTALATLGAAAAHAMPDHDRVLLSPRPSPWTGSRWWSQVVVGSREVVEWLDSFDASSAARVVLFVDDAEELFDSSGEDQLVECVRAGRSGGSWVVLAADSGAARRSYGELLTQIRRDRQGFVLQPDLISDGELLGGELPRRSTVKFPPGRGFFASRSEPELAQVIWPDGP